MFHSLRLLQYNVAFLIFVLEPVLVTNNNLLASVAVVQLLDVIDRRWLTLQVQHLLLRLSVVPSLGQWSWLK